MKDRNWLHLANPTLRQAEQLREEFDLKLLKKR